MNDLPVILLTPYQVELPRKGNDGNPSAGPRVRCRWRAELLIPHFDGVECMVDGAHDLDEAIGKLIRELAVACDTTHEAINVVASVFGDLERRSADVTLGRAIRLALRHPKRQNAGARIEVRETPAGLNGHAQAAVKKGGAK